LVAKLLVKLFIFSLVIIFSFTLILFIAGKKGRDITDYIYAPFDKVKLLANTPLPRIIMVGGSNIGFGLDSQKIKNAMGVNVVNMGLHAGLGLRYMLNLVKPYVQESDVVVIIPEYHQFFGELNGGAALARLALTYPELRKFIYPKSQYLNLLKSYPGILQELIYETWFFLKSTENCDEVYNRYVFNKLGDAVSHLNKKSSVDLTSIEMFAEKTPVYDSMTISVLNDFYVFALNKGARIYFMHPAIPSVQFNSSKKIIDQLDMRLKEKLMIPIVSVPEDFVMAPEYFFDTIYHLKKTGINIRTEKIISILKGLRIYEK
jgi:hypothetical protein